VLHEVYLQPSMRGAQPAGPVAPSPPPSSVQRPRPRPRAPATPPWRTHPPASSVPAPAPLPAPPGSIAATAAGAERLQCLAQADQYARARDEQLQRAAKAYHAGRGEVAAVYAEEGRRYRERMRRELERAQELAVEDRSAREGPWGLQWHGEKEKRG
jgi:hypothetical protein